jgi:hypothetical protein
MQDRNRTVPRSGGKFTFRLLLESTFLNALRYNSGHTVFVWSCRMRAGRDLSSAYQISPSSTAVSDWPQAGFIGIAYRLASLTVPRFGALLLVSAFFYLV